MVLRRYKLFSIYKAFRLFQTYSLYVMKNRLTEVYNKYLVIDPDIEKNYPGLADNISTMVTEFSTSERFKTLNSMYARSFSDIQYRVRNNDRNNNKPISGYKTFVSPELRLYATQSSFFPWETDLFRLDLSYIKFLIVELILEKYSCSLSELKSVYKGTEDIVETVIPDLETIFKDQEFYGFFGGDPYNHTRSRSLKKRKLEFIEFSKRVRSYYNSDRAVIMKDLKTKETLTINPGWGWCIYPSLEIMNTRLSDLEAYWMGKFDTEAKNIDNEIERTEKQLKQLKDRKDKYLNSVSTYSKKVKEVLWKDF